MSRSAATPDPDAGVPATDPRAVRARLPQALVAEFDVERGAVLEQAGHDMDLVPIRSLLTKWRHPAHAELRDPGSTKRLYERAAEIETTYILYCSHGQIHAAPGASLRWSSATGARSGTPRPAGHGAGRDCSPRRRPWVVTRSRLILGT